MGKKNRKNKKRKLSEENGHGSSNTNNDGKEVTPLAKNEDATTHPTLSQQGHDEKCSSNREEDEDFNPLLTQQAKFLSSLRPIEVTHYFSHDHVTPERRATLWMEQAELGEHLVNSYAWATPDDTALKIFQQFSPIIELGCGRNAYWATWMHRAGNVDVVAYDSNLQDGGVITNGNNHSPINKKKTKRMHKSAVLVQKGGPEVLKRPEHQQRTLFLCYPDEDDHVEHETSNSSSPPLPFGWHCLDKYSGTYVIHVGELGFLDPSNLSVEQAPWGRSSSLEFQQRLASEFHCVLKVQLPNWLHVRDSISVWKRSKICPIVFAAEDGDEDDEVVGYRHIPPDELLPQDVAAPCMAHLLPPKPTNAAGAAADNENEANNDKQQLLIQFQSKTHILSVPSTVKHPDSIDDSQTSQAILQHIAKSTGWSASRLRISHWNYPFVHVTAQSSIRGGKGGFGTLLKGQSRQAGAKLTTDFGACRDLQGRRLRHVNDEIKLRKFRERQRREQAGEKVDQDELWKTPSGIYNWHLMTPTWADISKKAAFRIKRQFRQMEREDQKKAALKMEQEEMHQKTIVNYLAETTALSESIQQDLGDAIKQGLKKAETAAKNAKKRKFPEDSLVEYDEEPVFTQEDRPSSLVSLTGEVVIVDSTAKASSTVQLQSKSDFMTAVLVLDGSKAATVSTCCYYEVTLITGGLAQIGWACLSGETETFQPNNETGDGVGDDPSSFGVDGSRSLKFHDGKEWSYPIEWKAGDCLGCLLECDNSEMTKLSFSVNGKDLGFAFTTSLRHLIPAFSCNQGEILELHLSRDDCSYFPSGKPNVVPVKELLQESDTIQSEGEKVVESSEVTKSVTDESKPKTVPTPAPTTSLALKEPTKPEPLDLDKFASSKELEELGLERLKSALMAIQVKCGGTLEQRAERLFSLKGLERKEYPMKVRVKGFLE
ncbi:telomere stability protein [Nitzschia inconspicua]|uniref:Telomere stability protein n=1 Tax=Nitzschia inconspicua TaxID=303405 RepID=A0A9K3L0N9_9STRA|nr:telomere stability protein [Nitzschia inconspicua]